MGLKYQENLEEMIATVLEKGNAHTNEIHRNVERILGYSISDNKLRNRLSGMVNDNLLNKYDETGKRGTKVFYSLIEKGKRKHQLKILGTNTEVQKRKNLYQLVIFFEMYKRGSLLTKRQLQIFLRKIGSSIDKLEKLQDDKHSNIVNFKPINGAEIMAITQDHRAKFSRTYYYVITPGLSVKEFVLYVKQLKFGVEPHPFTTYPARHHVPFINYTSFTRKEILSAVKTLKEDGLLESRTILDEERFVIKDENLRSLIWTIWWVHTLDVHLLHLKLIHKRPTDRDKEYLRSFVDEKVANKLRIHAYDIRMSNKHKAQARKKIIKSISLLEHDRNYAIRVIQEKYSKIIKEDEILIEMIEGACFSPVF